jgi:phage-related baseplate assembly protein
MALSFDDLYQLGKDEAQDVRPTLQVAEGDATDALLSGAAAMAEAVLDEAGRAFTATYLDGARGDLLTQLGDDRYGLPRNGPTQATGQVTFTRVTPGPAGIILSGTEVATARDSQGREVRFTVQADVTFALSEVGTKTVNAIAQLAGRAGNVAANTVTRVVSTIFDSSITVANLLPFVGGGEEESDDDYRERLRNFPKTLRRGTFAALEYGALQVPAVKRSKAIEEVDPIDPSVLTGIVFLYVSDADGNSSSGMVDDVKEELENWRAAGTVVNVVGATLIYQSVELTVTLFAGAVVSTSQISSAVIGVGTRLKPGQTLRRDDIKTAVKLVDPNGIDSVEVVTPGGDVVPSADVILRIDTVTVL